MSSPLCFRILILSLLVVVSPLSFIAQDKNPWRPITPEELEQKASKVEPDADAEAIFWEIRIDDSSSSDLSQSHYVRVKIFTERGRERFSKFDIPFLKGMKIKEIAARVVRPDGTITEIAQTDIFEREIVKSDKLKIKAKSFAVPGIEPGVIVEYRYREVIEDEGAVGMRLEFQKDIPVQTLSYYLKPYNKREPETRSFNFDDTDFVKDQKGYYLAQRKNIPAFKEEPRMPPEDMVRPWMILQSSSLEFVSTGGGIGISIRIPSAPNIYWASVAAEKAGLLKYMLKQNEQVAKAASDVTRGAATDEEKLRKVYEFVQGIYNTSWDQKLTFEDRKKLPKIKDLDDILKYKQSSAGNLNLLFGAMAGSLGYETRLAYSASRARIFFNSDMTIESLLRFSSIAVKVGSQWKFFDPGTPLLPYGMLLWDEEDVWTLLIAEKRFDWMKSPLTLPDKSLSKRTARLKLGEDGGLEGDVTIEYTGQTALRRRLEMLDDSQSKREEDAKAEAKEHLSAAEITDLTVENVSERDKPLVVRYRVKVPNYAQKTGKRMFIQPGYFTFGQEPVFSSTTRKYDIYFRQPWSEVDDIEWTLPPGYVLDNADRPGDIADGSNIGSLKISIGVTSDQTMLKYSRRFHFGGGGNILFGAGVYTPLKSLFDAFNKADNHTLTLRQK